MYNPEQHFHFIGIGGSGMSGIAEILLRQGIKVSGSDQSYSPLCEYLQGLGAIVFTGHSAEHLPGNTSVVVYSSAVPATNPEIQEAKKRALPIVSRGEVLAELMRLRHGIAVAGTHGKTTTTALVGHLLSEAELDPSIVLGGHAKGIGSGARLGKSKFFVAEADESDRSFLKLRPSIAIVTNIEAEHMENYSSFDDLICSFSQFIDDVPFYGLSVLCVDCPNVKSLSEKYSGRMLTYGRCESAALQAVDIEYSGRSSLYSLILKGSELGRIEVPFPGEHTVQNSLAAIAVALELGVSFESIALALKSFQGVKRRLEVISDEGDITVMSDYGHHPTELLVTIDAVRQGWVSQTKKLHVVFQPHRYSRTKDCFEQFLTAFSGCDSLLLTDIYSAGEQPIAGVSAKELCAGMNHPDARYEGDFTSAAKHLKQSAQPGDVVLCLGAGSVGTFAEQLPAFMQGDVVEFPKQ